MSSSGVDRERRLSVRSEWLISLGMSLAGWIAFAIAAGRPTSPDDGEVLDQLLSTAAAAFGTIAAVLLLVEWRARRDRRDLWLAMGFGLFALVRVGVSKVAVPMLEHGSAASRMTSSAAVLGSLLLIAMAVRSRVEPARTLPTPARAAIVGVLGLAMVAAGVDLDPVDSGGSGMAVHALVAAAWFGLAGAAWRTRRARGPSAVALTAGFVALAQGRLAVLLGTFDDTWRIAGSYFRVVGLLVVLVGAIRQLEHRYREQEGHLADSLAREALAAEKTHDLQAALFALEAAVRSLHRHSDALDPTALGMSTSVLEQEIARLRDVLRGDEPVQRFDVLATLAPIIHMARTNGATIELRSSDLVEAVGRPAEVGEAIRTLLDNARVHAPGAEVVVDVTAGATDVVIVVQDRGPGLPPGAEESVLLPGVRASRAPGQGLGLSSASRRMAAQGGTLRAEPCERGSRFVLTVPRAAPDVSP